MELILQRKPTIKDTTFGELLIDGKNFCYTLEDVVREVAGKKVEEWKIAGKTAIPVGRYRLELVNSSRFGLDTFSLINVPGFTSIRIHSGNDDADTEGCLLVGNKIASSDDDGGNILESKLALANLKEKLVPIIKAGKEEVWITVKAPSYMV